MRLERQQSSAATVARWLEKGMEAEATVQRVWYTGLESHPGHELHKRQASGDGCVLSVEMNSGRSLLLLLLLILLLLLLPSLSPSLSTFF